MLDIHYVLRHYVKRTIFHDLAPLKINADCFISGMEELLITGGIASHEYGTNTGD